MFRHVVLVSVLVVSAVSWVRADAVRTVVIPLAPLNGSGETGTATLRAQGSQTIVTVDLANGSSTKQPAHFHVGTCERYQPRPLYPINDIVDGKSTTTLDIPIEKLVDGTLILNVHKSYSDIATQAACGIAKS